MQNDLFHEVQSGIAARKGEWREIADAVDGVSYSFIAKLGRGKYGSAPTYARLQKVAEYLRTHPKPAEQVKKAA